jgi:ferric-dicitrate binding protein FerR (iron transport regulator)
VNTKITEELLNRYLAGRCTLAEEKLIADWYNSFDHLSPYFDDETCSEAIDLKAKTKTAIEAILAGQQQVSSVSIQIYTQTKRRRIFAYSSAAAIIILVISVWWMFSNDKTPTKEIVNTASGLTDTGNITPGANKAILTLADGSKVVLDNAANGMLAQQNNVQVVKSKDGELKYQPAAGNSQSIITYNMLSTPRGGQYMIVLPDGSKAWLNAASSIKYPTVFAGNERQVEIDGEVYFEVVPVRSSTGRKMPFRVKINETTQVEVLGTSFNINSYDDENVIKTTLLEGSVKVTKYAASAILKPGEQVSISQSSKLSQPIPVQTDQVMAWKNGLFQFNNVTIETVMRQVARWYDVQVEYERDVSRELFSGKIYRNADISQLLKILELSGAHFKTAGKKIIVQ